MEHEEWYSFFQLHKKKKENYFQEKAKELEAIQGLNLGHVKEAPIGFFPTYKIDEFGQLDLNANSSFADRVFYAESRALTEVSEVKVIGY